MKLLCAAMPHELSYVQGLLDNFTVEYIDSTSQTCLLHSLRTNNTYLGAAIGIGSIYIEECLDELAGRFYVSEVVFVGTAGGHAPQLSLYDVVIGEVCYLVKQNQIIVAKCSEVAIPYLTALLKKKQYHPHVGNFLTVQREVLSSDDLDEQYSASLQEATMAVDMEAGIVARWAKVRGISCSVVKVISDFLPLNKSKNILQKKIVKTPQFLQALQYSQQISSEILNYFDEKEYLYKDCIRKS